MRIFFLHPLRTTRTAGLSIGCLTFVLLLIFGVPVMTAVPLMVLSAVHVLVGALILVRCRRAVVSPSEFLGFGYAIGTVVAMSVDQIFVTTAFRDYSWTLLVLAIVLLLLVRDQRARTEERPRPHNRSAVTLATLSTLALVVLSQERYWPLYLAFGLLPLALYSQYLASNSKPAALVHWPLVTVAPLVAVGCFMQIRESRPNFWWIKTQDFQFFESLSYSLAHWGSHDQIYVTGFTVKYHWFSYAFTGMLSRITDADEWVILTRGSPVLITIGILLVAHAVFERVTNQRALLPLAMAVFVLLNDFNFESFSMVASYVWLLPAIWLCADFVLSPQITHFTLAPLLAAGAFGAKSSNAIIIVVTVLVVAVYALFKNRVSRLGVFSFLVAHGVALGIVFLSLYWNSPYSETVEIGIVGIARDLFGDLRDLNRPLLILASLIVLGNLVVVSILSFGWYSGRREMKYPPLQVAAFAALVAGVVPLAISRSEDYEIEEYFLHSMVLITSIVISLLVTEVFSLHHHNRREKGSRLILGLLGILTGAAASLWRVTNEGGAGAAFIRVVVESPILLVGALFIIITIITPFRAGLKQYLTLRVSVAVMAIVGIGATNVRWLTEYPTFRDEVMNSQHREFMLGSQDVIDGAVLIKRLTSEDDIIASNYFCENVPCATADYSPNRVNWKRGGEAMTLAVYSQRRFWVTGYGFLWQNVEPPPEVRARISNSLTSIPSDSGVGYYLRDRLMPCTCDNNWQIVGETERFQLFKL